MKGIVSPLRSLAALALAALLSLPVPAAAQPAELVARVVAVVNDKMITQYDLDAQMKPILDKFKGKTLSAQEQDMMNQARRQFLTRMVDDLLIEKEAEKYKITVSDQEVAGEIKRIKEKNNLSDAVFQQQLLAEGFTLKDFTEKMRGDMLKHRIVAGLVQRKVVITEDEIRKALDNDPKAASRPMTSTAALGTGGKVRLRLIILPPGNSADEVKRSIERKDTTFAEAADKLSRGPGAGQGGDLGELNWNDLAPQWKEALAGLKPGQISQPFKLNANEALLMLDSRDTGEKKEAEPEKKPSEAEKERPPIDPAVRNQIYETLYAAKMEELFKEFLSKLRAKAVIDIRL